MKLQAAALLLTGAIFVGCGGSSNSTDTGDTNTPIDLPDGLTMVFFDNVNSTQYLYDTTTEQYEDMNSDSTQNYDMTGKHGNPVVWFHHTDAGVDQKIVMLSDYFDVTTTLLTYSEFHYLGHFHEENNVKSFAAHSNEEFNPANNPSETKLAALETLNADLLEQEEIRAEIATALPAGETLCNFFVFDHEEHEEGATQESTAHIALSGTGMVYVFSEADGALAQSQPPFALEGVSSCHSSMSDIVKASDYGVLIFSAQSQKIYLVDNHGIDFHQHSSWDINRFLPAGFAPTALASITEESTGAHDH